jgi:hypothetical protein
MANVPVGPNRVSHTAPQAEETPKEAWRESVAASSRSAGNSFRANDRGKDKKGLPKLKLIAILVGVLVVLAAAFWWMNQQSNIAGQIDKSKYQAVFFTNGQVYFGKLSRIDGDFYKLTDIFYIQEGQKAASDSDNPQATETSQQGANPQLIKLGNEIHGPEDAMIINRDQVLFFENLKTDGKVSDVILKDRQQNQ